MNDSDDRDLRGLFRVARERDRARAPAFERVLAGPTPARRPMGLRLRPLLAVGAALALAVGAWWGVHSARRSRGLFQFRAGELRTPTDFLLDLASTEYLRTIPRIGRVEGLDLLAPPPAPKGAGDTANRSNRL